MVRTLEALERYAKEFHIPIMERDGIEFLTKYIKEHSIRNILEIGTAIGYSAIRMALVDSNIEITTIERDKERYEEAIKNVHNTGLDSRIHLLFGDAFDFDLSEKYDLIFIDAAKAQYIKFFDKFKYNLSKNGVIISDNLNFHGLVHEDTRKMSRSVRGLVRKLNLYIDFLKNNIEFETEFLNIGDGIGISKRK